jgi:diaminopimelate epimerase
MFTAFDKYEGLGNDFIVLDAHAPPTADDARAACDRNLGIGADGVLAVMPAVTAGACARMVVINADGSRPEMCGNGLRCVALYLAQRDGVDEATYVVDTDSGPRECVVEREDERGRVRIAMGRASREGEHRVVLDRAERYFVRMSIGNPHAILFDADLDDAAVDRLGPLVSGGIPGGSNVEIVRQTGPRDFELVVWERGVGRTRACGTGAAATAAALAAAGRAPFSEPVVIRLPGGPLTLMVAREDLSVTLDGPARRVFSGDWKG